MFVYLLSWSMFSQYASGEWQKNVAHGLGNYVHHAKGQVGLQVFFLSGIFLTCCWVSFWTTSGRSHFAVGSGPVVSGYQIHRSMAPGLATWFRRSGDPEGSIFEIAISVAEFEGKHWCMFWWNSCRITMCTVYKHNISWNEETNYWPLPIALVIEILLVSSLLITRSKNSWHSQQALKDL